MSVKQKLIQRIRSRQSIVGVIGMGYVGLPLAAAIAEKGYRVVGVDVNADKVAALNAATSYVEDVPSERLAPLVASGHLRASLRYEELADVDAISICVPTPLRKTEDPDISHVIAAVEQIAPFSGGKLIILESTTYPGTTEEIILPRLAADGAEVGSDFFLAFSPERIDPGRKDYGIHNTPKVLGGMTPSCLEVATTLYESIVETVIPVSSTSAAEMVKLLENTFRAVNIGLVNELALMCDRLDLDVWEIIAAAETKPFGFMSFYPGPGLGGHCIPVDPHYLRWKLRTLNYTARFIELAAEINGHMPQHVVGLITDVLNRTRLAVNGSKILILGVAYKRDVSDTRESPALDIIHLLHERGAVVSFHDPYVDRLVVDEVALYVVDLSERALREADCVVIVTDHSAYEWSWIVEQAAAIVDTRNALKQWSQEHIVRL